MSTTALNKPQQQQRVVLNVTPHKYDFFMELLGYFDFVQVVKEDNDGALREEIIAILKEAAIEQLIKAGKLEIRPLEELIHIKMKDILNTEIE